VHDDAAVWKKTETRRCINSFVMLGTFAIRFNTQPGVSCNLIGGAAEAWTARTPRKLKQNARQDSGHGAASEIKKTDAAQPISESMKTRFRKQGKRVLNQPDDDYPEPLDAVQWHNRIETGA